MKIQENKEFVYVLYRNVGNKYSKTEGAAWEYLGQFDEKDDIYHFLYSQLSAEDRGFIDKKIELKYSEESIRKEAVSLYKLTFAGENYECKLRILIQEVVEEL